VPSVHKKTATLPAVSVTDWALIDRLVEAYEPYGSVYLRAGGGLLADTSELQSAIEAAGDPPEFVEVLVTRGSRRSVDYVDATARLSSADGGSKFAVVSAEESTVDQILARTKELFDAAAVDDPALKARKKPSSLRRLVSDHGVSVLTAIVATVVGGLILAAILSRL